MTVEPREPDRGPRTGAPRAGPVFFVLVALLVAAPLALVHVAAPPEASAVPEPSEPAREIVFIVPGTLGNAETWFTQPAGQVTFASELRRGFERDVTARRLLWDGGYRQEHRERAAEHLAREIDSQSADYDRVHVVGHSHGGNVALMAARRAERFVDTIVCLATPHLYFEMARAPSRETVWVPLLVTPDLADHVGRIVNVHSTRDVVVDSVADWIDGMTVAEATERTRPWRRADQELTLYENDAISHLVGSSRVRAGASLLVDELALIEDVAIPTTAGSGLDVHVMMHGRRMGHALGLVLSGAPAEPILKHVLVTDETDRGEAIPAEAARSGEADPVGAWIATARVRVRPDLVALDEDEGWDFDGSLPDLQLRIDDEVVLEEGDALELQGEAEWLVPDGRWALAVVDSDLMTNEPIGEPWTFTVTGGLVPPVPAPSATHPWELTWETWPVW